MPFWLYMKKESVCAAENLPPELEMHSGIVEIPSEDLHAVSRYIAKWAWQYDKGALLRKCMLNWQKKNEVFVSISRSPSSYQGGGKIRLFGFAEYIVRQKHYEYVRICAFRRA